jgi:hypothetical protein
MYAAIAIHWRFGDQKGLGLFNRPIAALNLFRSIYEPKKSAVAPDLQKVRDRLRLKCQVVQLALQARVRVLG